jgi:hypothetical protein
MSRFEKLLLRFKSQPRDFTFDELRVLLRGLGYEEIGTGKTAGSRTAFFNAERNHIIRLHRPHPTNILKLYQIKMIHTELTDKGILL